MTSALDRSGYRIGSGLVSPDQSLFILTIPKNASSFIAEWAQQNDWLMANCQDCPDLKQLIIVLRDPVDRWISGISQYLHTYILQPYGPNGPIFPGEIITEHDAAIDAERFVNDYNLIVERLLLDVIDRFDDHVYEQCAYFDNVDPCMDKRFFMVGKQLTDDLSEYLNWNPPMDIDRNTGLDNPNTSQLQKFFKTRLQYRAELIPRIQKHYRRDQDLVNQYGRTR